MNEKTSYDEEFIKRTELHRETDRIADAINRIDSSIGRLEAKLDSSISRLDTRIDSQNKLGLMRLSIASTIVIAAVGVMLKFFN